MQDLITTIQLMIIVTYVTFIYRRYGLLTSISASTYYLEGNDRWYFLGFLWTIGLLNFFQGMEIYGFLTGAGLFFTGITINHESSKVHTDRVHQIGTVGAIIAAFTGLIVLYGMWIPTAILAICTALLYRNKYFIWWVECIAFALIIISYYLR